MLAQSALPQDLISRAIDNYGDVITYTVTLRSGGSGSTETIRYYYKKPGFIRMEFMSPYRGTVLVYDPLRREVRVRPFDFLKSFVITLDPDSRLLRSAKGHRVHESDLGTLLKAALRLRDNGGSVVLLDKENLAGRDTSIVEVRGREGFTVYGINSYRLWLDSETLMPLKASGFDRDGSLVEEVLMDDLEINPELPGEVFSIGE